MRVPGPGSYEIFVGARLDAGAESYVQGAAVYLIVAADGAITLTRQDPNRAQLDDSVMSTSVEPQVGAAATHAPNGDPCFNVSGTVMREEHTPFRSGYQPLVYVPVRSALIEMREEDTLFDDTYGEMLTGNDGSFSFSFCDDDGVFDDELEIYVRLTAEIQAAATTWSRCRKTALSRTCTSSRAQRDRVGGRHVHVQPAARPRAERHLQHRRRHLRRLERLERQRRRRR